MTTFYTYPEPTPCSAIDVLELMMDQLRCCTCGRDHSAELAEMGAALFALRPAAQAPHGH